MTNGRKVFEKIRDRADAAVFFNETDQLWLTGFFTTDGLVVVNGEKTLLITDSRYFEAAELKKQAHELQDDVEVILLDKGINDAFGRYANEKRIAFDSEQMTVSRLEGLKKNFTAEFVGIPAITTDFRAIKSDFEVSMIEKAQSITDAAFDHILGYIKPGLTETDVAAELEYFMKKKGAQCPAFETIAVSGKKSSMPHGVPESIVLTENSFLTMDFGAKYNGYCSDMTRTVVLGKADDEMKRVYNTVLEAQLAGIAAAHGGALGKDVDKAARDIIDNAGYKGLFGHSLGHSLGIEIHENPRFAPKFDKECPVQSIITVEPGIYIPGKYGVRIEDMILLGKDGCRDLTHSPKQLIEI